MPLGQDEIEALCAAAERDAEMQIAEFETLILGIRMGVGYFLRHLRSEQAEVEKPDRVVQPHQFGMGIVGGGHLRNGLDPALFEPGGDAPSGPLCDALSEQQESVEAEAAATVEDMVSDEFSEESQSLDPERPVAWSSDPQALEKVAAEALEGGADLTSLGLAPDETGQEPREVVLDPVNATRAEREAAAFVKGVTGPHVVAGPFVPVTA